MRLDPFKKFKLPKPIVCGLVMRITSPKGVREWNDSTQQYHYRLHTDNTHIYEGGAIDLTDGLWWVVDIAKIKDLGMTWNHYLLKVDGDNAEILESYVNVKGTDWIPEALPTIKQCLGASKS